jgi:hypothetical protein
MLFRCCEALNNEQLRRRAELVGRTISDRDASANALGIIEEAVARHEEYRHVQWDSCTATRATNFRAAGDAGPTG